MGTFVHFQSNLQTFSGKTCLTSHYYNICKKSFFFHFGKLTSILMLAWVLNIVYFVPVLSTKIVENVIKLTLVNIYLHLLNMTGLDKHNVMTPINVPIITHLNAVVNQTVRAMFEGKSSHYVHNLFTKQRVPKKHNV